MTQIQYDEQLIAELVEAQPQAVIWFKPVWDSGSGRFIVDFKYSYCNKEALLYTGLSMEQILGLCVNSSPLLDEQAREQVFDELLQVYLTGKPINIHHFNQVIGKHVRVLRSRIHGGVLSIIQDRTEEYKIIEELRKSQEVLKKTNANLEEFTYAASHDLKEPIRKIRTFAGRLRSGLQSKLTEKEEDWFNRLENATDRMKLLVDDLLAYSYVNLNADMTEYVDLNNKLQLVLGDLELMIEEKEAKIEIGQLPTIRGFRRQLQQLFQNLINNALKYSKPGMPPEIRITCRVIVGRDSGLNMSTEEQNQEYYLIEVMDNGIGFEQKDAEKIFNVFQRLHGNNEYKGTGVGLSIARKVAENHKGFLTAKGIPGTGATFQILLPVTGIRPAV